MSKGLKALHPRRLRGSSQVYTTHLSATVTDEMAEKMRCEMAEKQMSGSELIRQALTEYFQSRQEQVSIDQLSPGLRGD